MSRESAAVDLLRAALDSLLPAIEVAFAYGSMAKGNEHAGSDCDVMVIGTVPSNAAVLEALSPASAQLGRAVNPTLYTLQESVRRVADGRSLMLKVLQQPKIFVKGSEHDITRLCGGAGESGSHREA